MDQRLRCGWGSEPSRACQAHKCQKRPNTAPKETYRPVVENGHWQRGIAVHVLRVYEPRQALHADNLVAAVHAVAKIKPGSPLLLCPARVVTAPVPLNPLLDYSKRKPLELPKFTNPNPIIPRSQISRPRNVMLTIPFSTSRRPRRDMPQLEPKYNLKATIPSNSC